MNKKTLKSFLEESKVSEELFSNFYDAVKSGNNIISHNQISEKISLDDDWIKTIEDNIYFIEEIVKNPKKFIVDDDIIVEVERAKKTTAKTIRHLASHTKNIASIDENGDVRPKKVLTTEMNEFLAIYENRFVTALINRLVVFVEKRYSEIEEKIKMFDVSKMSMNSSFNYGELEVNYNLGLTVRQPCSDVALVDRNEKLIGRIDVIRRRLQVLKNTEFVRSMSAMKPVTSPIMKTNIIKMNVNYKNCYKLWLFISAYTTTGYSVEMNTRNFPAQGDFYDDMTFLAVLSLKSLIKNDDIDEKKIKDIEFKPTRAKRIKINKKITYTPTFYRDVKPVSDEAVNEYYFLKMKEIITEQVKKTEEEIKKEDVVFEGDTTENIENDDSNTENIDNEKTNKKLPVEVDNEEVLTMNFERFYNVTSKITNELYYDLIRTELEDCNNQPNCRTVLEKKEQAFKNQLLLCRRIKQLNSFKQAEYENFIRRQEREMQKLEKLEANLKSLKSKSKKPVANKPMTKQDKIKNFDKNPLSAVSKAKLTKEQINREKELMQAKRVYMTDKKSLSIIEENAKNEIELLQNLMEKYENKDIKIAEPNARKRIADFKLYESLAKKYRSRTYIINKDYDKTGIYKKATEILDKKLIEFENFNNQLEIEKTDAKKQKDLTKLVFLDNKYFDKQPIIVEKDSKKRERELKKLIALREIYPEELNLIRQKKIDYDNSLFKSQAKLNEESRMQKEEQRLEKIRLKIIAETEKQELKTMRELNKKYSKKDATLNEIEPDEKKRKIEFKKLSKLKEKYANEKDREKINDVLKLFKTKTKISDDIIKK